MSFQSEVLAGFEDALRLYRGDNPAACKLTYKNREYDCIPAPSPDATTLVAGGWIDDYQASVTCRVADFDQLPRSGETILRNGRQSKILRVEPCDPSPLFLLHYGTVDR